MKYEEKETLLPLIAGFFLYSIMLGLLYIEFLILFLWILQPTINHILFAPGNAWP
jgi:hypothetical protein